MTTFICQNLSLWRELALSLNHEILMAGVIMRPSNTVNIIFNDLDQVRIKLGVYR